MSNRMAEKYKFLQKASISEHYLFAWKVFASWDFTITSKETATYKRNHLTTSLKVQIAYYNGTLINIIIIGDYYGS